MLVITEWFLDREYMIRTSWNVDRMLFQDGNRAARIDETSAEGAKRVNKCNEGVSSYFFWAYLHVLRCFARFLRRIVVWCGSCICHPRAVTDEFDLRADQYDCPMRGRKAAAIACGELDRYVESRLQLEFGTLLHALRGLSTAQRRIVLDIFEIGKSEILAEYAIRFSCYQQLPLKLLCIGHHNVRTAREHLVHCLCLYELLPGSGSPFTEDMLNVAHKRNQVLAVVQGHQTFDHFPELNRVRACAVMTSTMEISVERLHEDLHQNIKLAPNHSPAYASLSLRKGMIMRAMEDKPDLVFRLVEILSIVRTGHKVIQALNLLGHPAVAQYLNDEGQISSSIPFWVIAQIVYRCDAQTQFTNLVDAINLL